jgi:hypothetical protein
MKTGKTIIPTGVFPERHELETASFFTSFGKDVEFLIPNRSKHAKTPDVKMDGILWEIKCPKSAGKQTIEHSFKKALRQSENIIFDLRRSKMPDKKCISKLVRQFELIRGIKQLLIITKSGNLKTLDKTR